MKGPSEEVDIAVWSSETFEALQESSLEWCNSLDRLGNSIAGVKGVRVLSAEMAILLKCRSSRSLSSSRFLSSFISAFRESTSAHVCRFALWRTHPHEVGFATRSKCKGLEYSSVNRWLCTSHPTRCSLREMMSGCEGPTDGLSPGDSRKSSSGFQVRKESIALSLIAGVWKCCLVVQKNRPMIVDGMEKAVGRLKRSVIEYARWNI